MKTIQLQGVGHVEAVEAATIKAGDVRMYNFGSTATIIKVIDKTVKTLTVITVNEEGKYHMFDIRKSSLVAIVKHDQDVSMHNPKEAYNVSGRNKGMVDVSEHFQDEQTEEEKLVSYHIDLQERGMAFTESKPVINKESTYKVIVSKDRENNRIGEFEKVLSGKELEFQLFMNEVLEIIEEIQTTPETHQEITTTEYSLTEAQEITLEQRLNKDNVKPLRLFYKNDVVLLECLNTNLNNPKPFYFVIFENGNEMGKGYDYPVHEYKLIKEFNSTEKIESEKIETPVIQQNNESGNYHITDQENSSMTYIHNEERNSIEITFNEKPSEEIRSLLKANSFRWAKYNKVWYKKSPTEKDFSFVESLGVIESSYNSEHKIEMAYPEIEIDDILSYTIAQDIQDREHDNNWITRTHKRDHNKEIQGLFESVQNEVLELLETTDNKRIQYDIKRSLQYFKKHYHETYLKYITAKANTPSWITTGRGGLNVSRYNKKMAQIDNHMLKLTEIKNEMDKRFNKAKQQIRKDEKSRITAVIENCGLDIEFKMVKKEFEYMGIKENRKVHCFDDYWIAKTWGCFRVFKGNKEIHSCKTAEKLDHAKKYVVYHIEKEKMQNAV